MKTTPAKVVARFQEGDQIMIELAQHVMKLPDQKSYEDIRRAANRYIELWEEAEAIIETACMPDDRLELRLSEALRKFDEEYDKMEKRVLSYDT